MFKQLAVACLVTLAASVSAFAVDTSVLKAPAGARVAIVMFEDMECPECANAYPLVWEAAIAHRIPVVLHDFPLPRHNWSFDAAVWARYFDSKASPKQKIGNDFRRYIFANQRQITRDNLLQWVQKFGDENRIPIPAANDPDGTLTAKVKADYALGQRIGVERTPTLWVVGQGGVSRPMVEEIKDRAQLNQMIEDVLAKSAPAAPAKKNNSSRAQKTKQGVR
jgi:protein-disulfide isomerase